MKLPSVHSERERFSWIEANHFDRFGIAFSQIDSCVLIIAVGRVKMSGWIPIKRFIECAF
nr:hypothetical protein [Paenibacillus pasadenensis]